MPQYDDNQPPVEPPDAPDDGRATRTMRRPGRLGVGTLSLTVLALALPVLGEQFLMLLLGWSDLYLTKTIVEHPTDAKTAVGIGGQLMWLMSVFFSTVGVGATAIVARSIGSGNHQHANRTARQALMLGFAFGLLVATCVFTFARPLLWVLQLRGQTLDLAVVYVRTYIPGLPVSVLMFMGGACLRGAGDTRTPLLVIGLANVINIICSWVLRFGGVPTTFRGLGELMRTGSTDALNGHWISLMPAMGLRGIAAGTLIAFLFGGTLMVVLLWRGRGGLRVRFHRKVRPDLPLIGRILRVGIFSGIESLMMAGASTAVAAVINYLGPISYAAYIVSLRLESASFLPGFAFAHAGGALVGQSLGAGRPDRASRCGWWAYAWGGGLMTIMGLMFVLFPHSFVGIFVDASTNADEAQVDLYATQMIRICGFVQPFLAALLIFAGQLKGAGDTRFPAAFTSLGVVLIRLPGALIVALVLKWNVVAVWAVMCGDLVFRGSLMCWRFTHGGWKKTRV